VTASELLERVRADGFTVTPGAAGTLVVAPASRLTDELRAALRCHKAEVLALLAGPPPSALAPDLDAHRAPRYTPPWPDAIPDLGPRRVRAFDLCADCGAGTWVAYGSRLLCLACARRSASSE
jgi:hypothetical protein